MMKKEELQAMKVSELAAICKANNTPHYHGKNRFKKDELVEAILGAESTENSGIGAKDMVEIGKEIANGYRDGMQSAKDEVKTDNHDVEAEDKVEKESANVDVDMEQKMPYIEGAVVGTIVAFRLPNGKVKSAKIIKKSTKRRQFMLETDYGAQYITPYEDIIWVRTGKRWPRGVYKLLKGLVDVDETKAN